MSRLADYFVVVGYDHEKERSGISSGIILQRFPERDWPDTPFIEGIEWFCQPQGWALSTERQEPRFFVSVLTDIDANRHYCACLCFNETVSITPSKPVDEEEDTVEGEAALVRPIPAISHHSIMYAPKCLVLVSRLDYIETFRNCLGIIYSVYIENMPVPLETLVGNILGCIQVPPPGGPQVRFSIGAGDRQALQPPLSPSLPVTHCSVNLLFHQLGIRNVLVLFCAIMTEHKILFHSKSYNRLTEACRALTALMYPFRYTHVFIPLLPAPLVEVLSTPTPFIMGVHSSLKSEVAELMDVIVADLDGGSITIPDGISLPLLSEPLLSNTQEALSLILQPELSCADHAFPPLAIRAPQPVMLDKEIRAVFMRTFAQLLQGYRSCLTLIRIHPKPVITFHKAAFLGERNLKDCDFTTRVLDCMFYTSFVSERGPPWRPCDVWDELYSNLSELIRSEIQDPRLILEHIQQLATQLYTNETPNPQSYAQKILVPPEGAFARIHQPPLPLINSEKVQAIIDEGLSKNNLKSRLSSLRPIQPRIVPMGPNISNLNDNKNVVSNSARRLEVLRNCINCIFENKISDARKTFPAVLRALQSKQARLALCNELSHHVSGTKAMLEHQQFDLVVRLMNCALQDDSSMDEHGVAAALLPLATIFCRKLCTGIIQFAYTCIQEHAVWQNQQFWEAAFYQDVQKDIKALYTSRAENLNPRLSNELLSPTSPRESKDFTWHRKSILSRVQEATALEIAAEQMRIWNSIDPEKQKELITCEENTMYSQAIHYANRMVYLLIPLDMGHKASKQDLFDDERASNSIANSVAESDSADAESGFEDQDPGETGNTVIRIVSRFIDKVCNEGGVTRDHIRNLHQMIPGVVHMHIETLEAVHRESKRLPPIQKPKILTPNMLPGEECIMEGLRVYLLPDGREESSAGLLGGLPLLPAEGAIFLTNYRIIFKGIPCDSFACEQVVVRSFPVTSLTKEKKVAVQYLAHLDQWLQEGLQLRSCTFQLMKLAFDEEVTAENIDTLRKLIHKIRHPPDVFHHFAFTGQVVVSQTPLHKNKEKNATLRGFAKKTLLKTARKAGFKQKSSSKRQKYVLPNMNDYNHDDDLSIDDFETGPPSIAPAPADAKTLERLQERSYVRDWQRLGICGSNASPSTKPSSDHFRLTTVNSIYMMCRSYPALLLVPASVTDESIRRFCRCYRQGRIPSTTWRHPRTKAILLRGAGHHGKSVMGMLKSHPTPAASTETTSSTEQEKYLSSIVSATPVFSHRPGSGWGMSDSSLSIDSLLLAAEDPLACTTLTPEVVRRSNPFNKAIGTLGVFPRSSGGKGPKNFGRWGSLKDRRQSSQASLAGGQQSRTNIRHSTDMDNVVDGVHTLQRAALYILGEKAQMKIKIESAPKTDFIPVEYYDVRHTKAAFKKLMRACIPSSQNPEPEHSFHRLVEHSEWLQQIQNIMQLSGAVVDLLDLQGSSVAICLEDGWDITAQVSSVAQLCLDPHYRTLEGFRILVEKEWIGFGHRFSHRSNLNANSQASGFAPTFLQFLDVVHQIQKQYPMAFEFNDYYLRFLAYHSVSCRFRTFLFDCELERVESGVAAVEDKRGSLTSHHKSVDTISDDENIYPGGRISSTSQGPNLGQSVFDYIEKQHARSPLFFNFMYTPDFEHPVLRPQSHLPSLEVWNYYLDEDLHYGPNYDLEIIQMDSQQEEEAEAADGINKFRKIVCLGYDNVNKSVPDAFSHLLEEIHRLESELGHLPQKWKVLWDKLELPITDSLTRHSSFSTALVRSHGKQVHKRSTLEILMRGKIVGAAETSLVYSHPHRFERYNYTTPTYCDLCGNLLWGPVKTGMRCMDCGYSCHEKCMESVPKNCTKYKSVSDSTTTQTIQGNAGDNGSVSSGSARQTSSQQYYDQFSSNVAEDRTHEGYLYKRGALLKGWKQRWFVLDSIKHQLRYYDAMEDSHCKGYIDLAEVMSVNPAPPAPGPPKKTDDKSFFDLRTSRRTYNFCATDTASAQEWIEKLQACL
ncbi:myotubularin-related protein 13 isoform X2 [Anoplophora glabripennis]|uniref:myotubularin-related protein 13 isoform X2 n=1 Tax=Anoplophora glabripennis TaxID=217634 RepID=UPI000873A72F|nr:myotubularin-related protein 13 isoform X2 [Anoplophora glabripennis]